MRALSCGVAVLLLTGVMAAPAAAQNPGAEELSITKSSFGTVGSQPVDRYTLANHDMSVSISGGLRRRRAAPRPRGCRRTAERGRAAVDARRPSACRGNTSREP